jgi:alpha-glucosidase
MMRPLFMEFPDAAPDRHPLDLDAEAASEFLLGPALLVAPPQYADELDPYSIELPTADWYNYWTGERVSAHGSMDSVPPNPSKVLIPTPTVQLRVSPALDQLPVFVRAGAILPIAPIVQSTYETPRGPLTLRVFAGDQCNGELYQDDGVTYAFQKGAYLRMHFNCAVKTDTMRLEVSRHEGTYRAWWDKIHIEINGWKPQEGRVFINGQEESFHLDQKSTSISLVVKDSGEGMVVDIR